jgi:hypothetical protein
LGTGIQENRTPLVSAAWLEIRVAPVDYNFSWYWHPVPKKLCHPDRSAA